MHFKKLICLSLLAAATTLGANAQFVSGGGNTYVTTGNVGIGTASPQEPLTVASSNAFTLSLLRNAGGGNITSLGTTTGAIYFGAYDPGASARYIGAMIRARITEAWAGGTAQGVALTFETAANGTTALVERVRIDNDGNVGIGESSPVNKLDIRLSSATGQWLSTVSVQSPAVNAVGSGLRFSWGTKTTGPTIRFVHGGDYNNAGLAFSTLAGASEVERMRIDAAGNVGIGRTAPSTKLDVAGTVKGYIMAMVDPAANNVGYLGRGQTITSGWTATPDILALTYFERDFAIGGWKKSDGVWGGASLYINSDNGNVGIGTTDPKSYKLAVNGTGMFTKVMVKPYANWADYVFDKDYKLPSLNEVENFIQQNKHLPDVPSAKEVAANGIDLGDNQVLLLKKVEELTLYSINQEKEISGQKKDIINLKEQLQIQNELVQKLIRLMEKNAQQIPLSQK